MNPYERAREERIAHNRARLVKCGVLDIVSQIAQQQHAKLEKPKTRVTRVKGAAPTRKSERSSQLVHAVLSEVILSREKSAERPCYQLTRKRFETERMPSKRKAPHEFDEAHVFKNSATQSAAEDWFHIFKLQPELNALDWEPTCEHLAYNLGQEGLTKDSLAGENEETATFVYDTAIQEVADVTAGAKIALKRVLKHLRSGETAAPMAGSERRHGAGQSTANATFRHFTLNMISKYGDHARKGIKHFESDPERKKEVAKVISETWLLVKDKRDAQQMYGSDNGLGSGHTYDFRKVLIRKFEQEEKKFAKIPTSENEDPNSTHESTNTT